MELRIVIAASALAVAGLVLAGLSSAALGAAKAAAKWPSADRPALGIVPARIGVGLGVALCGASAGLAASTVSVDEYPAWVAVIAAAVLVAVVAAAWAAVKLAGKIELSALINSPSPMGGEPQTATSRAGTQPPVVMGPPVHGAVEEIAYGQPYPGVVEPPALPVGVSPPSGSPVAPSDIHSGHTPVTHVDAVHTTTLNTAVPATQNTAFGPAEPKVSHVQSPPSGDQPDHCVPAEALPGWVYTDEADDWYLVASILDGRRLMRLTDFGIAPPGSVTGRLRLAGSIEMTVWPAETTDSGIPGRRSADPQSRETEAAEDIQAEG